MNWAHVLGELVLHAICLSVIGIDRSEVQIL